MLLVGERIDDVQVRRRVGEALKPGLREGPDDGAVHPALEIAGDIFDGLAAAERDIGRQLDDFAAELAHGDDERRSRAERRLLEEQRDVTVGGQGAIHAFAVRALQGEDLVVHNDGSQIRAWCYVDDIVDGVILALTRAEAVGQAFNIGNPRSVVTVYNLAREIIRVSNSNSRIRFENVDRADVELRIPSIAKARQLLGFEPRVDLEEGLQRTIAWYRHHLAPQAAAG